MNNVALASVTVPSLQGDKTLFEVSANEIIFGLGPNGTGKSSFVSLLARASGPDVTRILGNREVTMQAARVNLILLKIIQADVVYKTMLHDKLAGSKTSKDDAKIVKEIKEQDAPLDCISRIMEAGGLHFLFSHDDEGRLTAQNCKGAKIPINKLSDGERAAFLIACEVFLAPEKSLILLDEPERHLHRSISAPLIRALLSERADCGFMILTHDISLPLSFKESAVLLFRDYEKDRGWSIERIDRVSSLPEDILTAILGARDKILFVEGDEGSLDRGLYEIIYPSVSVVPSGSCSSVKSQVRATNSSMSHHRIHAFGLIDGDRINSEECERLKAEAIYPIKVNSIEGLYFHPKFISEIAKRLAQNGLLELQDSFDEKLHQIYLEGYKKKRDKLVIDAKVRTSREVIFGRLPTHKDFEVEESIWTQPDIVDAVNQAAIREETRFDELLDKEDVEALVQAYSVKRSSIPSDLIRLLNLSSVSQFVNFVQKQVRVDPEYRKLFLELGDLPDLS
jgi:ABC-type cobalamin/Fe3+-siderophores transport system ATPase subunit